MWSMIGGMLGMSALNSAASAADMAQAYAYQSALLEKQQKWSEYMSNTAHQREVKDLREAGLNPILSATGGNGASSPVVSAPAAPVSGFKDVFSNSAKASADLKRAFTLETDKIKADIRNSDKITDATVRKLNSEAERNENLNKPIRKGGDLFDATVNSATSFIRGNVTDPLIGGVHSAAASEDTQRYLKRIETARGYKVPLGEAVGSHLIFKDGVNYGRYRSDDGSVKRGYFVPRKKRKK